MNNSSHKARHRLNYTFPTTGGKLAISGSIFLTTTFMCIIYFSTPYGASRNIISNFSSLPIQQDKIIVAEEEDDNNEPFRSLNDPMYTLGPKINDWDLNRANWLRLNPEFPNFFSSSKPRVLLVTGSSPTPCENPIGDFYQVKAIKNKIDYCRIHGIDIFYNTASFDAEMAGFWSKLPLLRTLLLSHPEVEFFWWMDSDAFFTDMAFEPPWDRYKPYNLVFHGWDELVYKEKNWIGLNTGSFFLRNCQWSLDLLDAWAPMGPSGPVREEAGKRLAGFLKGRPVFEADDQSALVYLLVTQHDTWSDKVYLENSYYLHGFWEILVDRYEEMVEKNHPGLGDDRWPLVTHFVGCKPCKTFSSYPIKRCLKQMDRAFYFADNQVLQMYGFAYKSLNTSSLRRVREQSVGPADANNEVSRVLYPSLMNGN
ncbi:Galactosyl transferase GMA12/MNN10 family protein [Rhynchospora pubera]|uniref:Galactosyl transferase GMA12/MNN10 family protein n=1 Tax=Rhynchospora pubera TaxID=906938 RepID=A0AAV8FK31_9POAL|nr:Galactosyl transferase GMA12/MNN10 family protein [Rhynchospora pubera]KAJ4793334.1 Galactosyl transferase GMA12/MNN10 family protein [Rhynchospora pubera]